MGESFCIQVVQQQCNDQYPIDPVRSWHIIETEITPLYRFDVATGAWAHVDEVSPEKSFSLRSALCATHLGQTALSEGERRRRYAEALDFARARASELAAGASGANTRLEGEAGELQFFTLPEACTSKERSEPTGSGKS